MLLLLLKKKKKKKKTTKEMETKGMGLQGRDGLAEAAAGREGGERPEAAGGRRGTDGVDAAPSTGLLAGDTWTQRALGGVAGGTVW